MFVLDAVQQLGEDTAKAAAVPLWSLADTDLTMLLEAAHRLVQAAAIVRLKVIQEATSRDLPAARGYRSVAGWLTGQLRLDPYRARQMADLAAALRARPGIEQAALDGRLDLWQAAVIADAVAAIPATLAEADALADDAEGGFDGDPRKAEEHDTTSRDGQPDAAHGDAGDATCGGATDGDAAGDSAADGGAAGVGTADGRATDGSTTDGRAADNGGAGNGATDGDTADVAADPSPSAAEIAAQAEAVLIEMAGQFPASPLRRLGDRILAHVAPEIADRADEAALRRQEARAQRKRHFTLLPPVDGMVRITGLLGVEDAATVRAALDPLCTPRPGDDRAPGQRRADALTDICRLALRTSELPEDGGEPAQVTVTIPYDPTAARLGIGTLDTGDRVSAATARRMACDARILPIVLGGAGQVLDAGRTRRLATGALRRALVARDHGCTFPGCDRPSRWCDGHHLKSWAAGGLTSLNNLVLLCGVHHRLIHDPAGGWHARLGADQLPEFLPPPWIDPQRRPRRNMWHPRK